jgi:hypothetical protein
MAYACAASAWMAAGPSRDMMQAMADVRAVLDRHPLQLDIRETPVVKSEYCDGFQPLFFEWDETATLRLTLPPAPDAAWFMVVKFSQVCATRKLTVLAVSLQDDSQDVPKINYFCKTDSESFQDFVARSILK